MKIGVFAKMVLCTVLIFQLALPGGGFAAQSLAPRHNALLGVLLDELGSRYERVMTQVPQKTLVDLETRRKIELENALHSRAELLREDLLLPSELREEALRVNLESLKQEKAELLHQIRNLPAETLDRISESMRDNPIYNESRQDYEVAYTQEEKARALSSAVFLDLDHHFSMLNKRSAYMSKEGWIRDLAKTRALYSTKAYGNRRWLKVLGIAALGVAAAGLVSWGVASSVYGGRYNQRKTELDNQYEALRRQLEQHYNELSQRLTAEERNYLQENGYVWMTCDTYERPDSILCNRYDYALFQGTRYCSVQCFRNPATGKETLYSAPSCTTPFVPSNCYDPSEYEQGYDDGNNEGYNDGYDDGWSSGDEDGANDGYEDGYDDGYDDGYNQGYDDGFTDGYYAFYPGEFSALARAVEVLSTKTDPQYKRGYDVGFRDASTLFNL